MYIYIYLSKNAIHIKYLHVVHVYCVIHRICLYMNAKQVMRVHNVYYIYIYICMYILYTDHKCNHKKLELPKYPCENVAWIPSPSPHWPLSSQTVRAGFRVFWHWHGSVWKWRMPASGHSKGDNDDNPLKLGVAPFSGEIHLFGFLAFEMATLKLLHCSSIDIM